MSEKVLVIEDDVFIRAMIAEFLRDAGFDILEAADADEAISILESDTEIDVLFTDIRMPGSMDGAELARRVKAKWPSIHVILTSGHASALLDLREETEDQFLPKPYRPLSVLAAILSAVDP